MRYGSLAIDEIATETAPIAERILGAGRRRARPHDDARVQLHRVHAFEALGRDAQPVEPVRRGRRLERRRRRLPRERHVAARRAAPTSAGRSGIPASINGVVGFKPPHGRVPTGPPFNLDRFCHDGPLARTVADCALFENVMAGPHPLDVTSLRPKLGSRRT